MTKNRLEYMRKWYQRNKKRIEKYKKIYKKMYDESEHGKQKNKEYREINKKRIAAYKENWYYNIDFKARAAKLWNRAKTRNKPNFQITKKWIEKILLLRYCQVTGIEFSYDKPKPHYNSNPFAPSLDRKDCRKGYTRYNTQVVIWGYNVAKHDLDPDDFKKLIRGINEHFIR